MSKKLIIKGADFSVNGLKEHYLEYDGNSYFSPNIEISDTDRIEIKFMLSQLVQPEYNAGMGVFFGRFDNMSDDNAVGVMINPDYVKYPSKIGVELPGTNRCVSTYKAVTNTMYNVVFDSQTCVINGQTITLIGQKDWLGPQKFFLGAMGSGTTSLSQCPSSEFFHGRIYGLKIYNSSNVLKHDLEPYADNTVIDVVTNTLFYNLGTGNAVYI